MQRRVRILAPLVRELGELNCFLMFISCWNIRGLNRPNKQSEVTKFIFNNHIDVMGIVETKIKDINKTSVQNRMLPSWDFVATSSNRVWVTWNPKTVNVTLLRESKQLIHVLVEDFTLNKIFEVSFVYGLHTSKERRDLWRSLSSIHSASLGNPWMVLGDFNEVLAPVEIHGGNQDWDPGMAEFNDFMNACCLVDLRYTGCYYSWSNKRTNSEDFIERKLDRVIINNEWLDIFPASHAHFHPPGISDHSPIVVDCGQQMKRKGLPFKFYNYWTTMDNYDNVIAEAWSMHVEGTPQFQLCHKLRNVKNALKVFSKHVFGKERIRADLARTELLNCQYSIANDPDDVDSREREKILMVEFLEALRIEEEAAKQKSRVQWLDAGDRNTKFFYNSIKSRKNRKRIVSLITPNGSATGNEEEAKVEAIRFFKSMMGTTASNHYPGSASLRNIVHKRISPDDVAILETIPNDEEIKNALFSIHSNKAPGPDGFNAYFFKHSWEIVGPLVTLAIKDFFTSKEILREANATIISLIPKVPNPSKMGDFRPISCCNTVYKCISKIISKRLQGILPSLIDHAQSAFIKGRKICDNVLLAQDLLRDYHKEGGKPRGSAKIDIMKAYDTLNWEFLMDLLHTLGFPDTMICWIKACVTSPRYSINFNGESIGYFEGARGLRQGDPMSPYLFVIAMEFLSQLIAHHISNSPSFGYHHRCDKLGISHLCFADDLLILFAGNVHSAQVVRSILNHFYDFTGLKANDSKSCAFYAGIDANVGNDICNALQFPRGILPMKYLGVPLITTKLKKGDCEELIRKISARITSWKSKFLSYAGRIQLINSVLYGIQSYWSSMFILPKSVLKDMEILMSRFLWNGDVTKVHGIKISWDKVCTPKKEGGLGIKRLTDLNNVLNMKHIWNILSPNPQSLWIKWVHTYLIKGSSFWVVRPPSLCSWYWKKLLKLRTMIRPFLKHKIGNGDNTFLWHDNWHPKGPLTISYGDRVIYDAGIPSLAKVNYIINDNSWDWPIASSGALIDIKRHMAQVPTPRRVPDSIVWVPSTDGKFQIKATWAALFPSVYVVPWHGLCWSTGSTPRHSFILWLACHGRLATHDRILHYTQGPLACVFCVKDMESHDHLFFQCPYTCFIWQGLLHKMGIPFVQRSWEGLTTWASTTWKKKKKPIHVIPKLCMGATVYHIWRERNERTFGTDTKPKEVLMSAICAHMKAVIRLRWRNDTNITSYLECWN